MAVGKTVLAYTNFNKVPNVYTYLLPFPNISNYKSLLPSLTRQNHPRLLPNSPYSVHGSRFPIHMQYCRICSRASGPAGLAEANLT